MCSVKGREMAWKFVQDNWDEFHNRYEGGFLLSRLIKVKARLEQFSIECRKSKTKVITTANQNKDKYHNEPMRTQSKYR